MSHRDPLRPDRRRMIAGAAASGLAGMLPAAAVGAARSTSVFASARPPLHDRRYASPAVEAELRRVVRRIGDAELAWMFGNTFPNTLDTTVEMGVVDGAPDAFVITGDIPCLWLRDSAAQVQVYLPLASRDPALRRLFRGLIARHARCVLIDPYANAFLRDPTARTTLSWAKDDLTEMRPGVAERKWEVDSLCHVMRLAYGYWRATRDTVPFDALWVQSARTIVRTLREQQRLSGHGPYRFQRVTENAVDTLMLDGYGAPTRRVGLIHSMFRPSDDACVYPFLVPANLFAVTTLRELVVVARDACGDDALAADAAMLADEIAAALRAHALIPGADGGRHWAYEIDGFGNALFMDDANAPGLSSLAYLGCLGRDDAIFRRTEAMCWSERNPYFFRGRAGEGIGGPHTGLQQIWPMSIIMRALSSDDDSVIRHCLRLLKATHAGTGFIHESFDADDPAHFTRPWFAWANSLFAGLILDLAARRPALLAAPL